MVPTAVRVEAGWDRRAPHSAAVNRLQILDAPLDGAHADRAAVLRNTLDVSVADAHLGSTFAALGQCAVVTSDIEDMQRIADHLGVLVTVIRL